MGVHASESPSDTYALYPSASAMGVHSAYADSNQPDAALMPEASLADALAGTTASAERSIARTRTKEHNLALERNIRNSSIIVLLLKYAKMYLNC